MSVDDLRRRKARALGFRLARACLRSLGRLPVLGPGLHQLAGAARRALFFPQILNRAALLLARAMDRYLPILLALDPVLGSHAVAGRPGIVRLVDEACARVRSPGRVLDGLWSAHRQSPSAWTSALICSLAIAKNLLDHPAARALRSLIQVEITRITGSAGSCTRLEGSGTLRADPVPVFGRNSLAWVRERPYLGSYVAEVADALVMGLSFAVISGHTLWNLNDDAALPFFTGNYSTFFHPLPGTGSFGCPELHLRPDRSVDRAVHVSTRAGASWFHWMFECLPRVLLVRRFPEYAGWGLLVADGYPPQHYELLEKIVRGRCPILRLPNDGCLRVERLLVPSIRSFMPDDPRLFPGRSVIDPAAVRELREALGPPPAVEPRGDLLYVSRRKYAARQALSRVRDVANPERVARFLTSRGARIFYPEETTVDEQRLAFHHARTVVSLAGSALANLVFCRPGTRVLILSQESHVHPGLFTGVAQTLGLRPALVTGLGVPDPRPRTHWDVRIDLETLERAVRWADQPSITEVPAL